MTDTIRDLLISLASHMAYMQGQLEALHELSDPEDYYWYRESVLLRQKVTDALADEPAAGERASVVGEPTQRQLMMLADEMNLPSVGDAANYARAVLARWGNPAPQPVPVSEGLPRPKDCDAEGKCWWWYPEVLGKTYGYWAHEDDAVPERAFNEQPLHWLPARALPLPGQEVDG